MKPYSLFTSGSLRIAVAVTSLFLISSLPATAEDTDQDGMSDWFEALFGLNSQNAGDAYIDQDGDDLLNMGEAAQNTDPFEQDTDRDGLSDAKDATPLSRAVMMWGKTPFAFSNSYIYVGPYWWASSYKTDGQWITNAPSRWNVPSTNLPDTGSLQIDVNRSTLTNNAVLKVELFDYSGGSLYMDLYSSNGVVVTQNFSGNLMSGTERQIARTIILPLTNYPTATGVRLRRGTGQVSVYSCILYVDQDNDGLDADQETEAGTSDTNADTDGDGLSDYAEFMTYKTSPTHADPDGDGLNDGQEIGVHGTNPLEADTDHDGMIDGIEVLRGRNPASADNYTRLPFTENFETNTVSLGALNGQNGWEATPTNLATVKTAVSYNGSRAVGIGSTGNTTSVTVKHPFAASNDVVWCEMYMQISAATTPTGAAPGGAAFHFRNDGRLVVYDDVRGWFAITNMTPKTTGSWVKVSVQLDYFYDSWLLALDGTVVTQRLALSTNIPYFSEFTATGKSGQLDGIALTYDTPANLDFDGDGMADAWELQYFGSTDQNGSDDFDDDGLSNLDEAIQGTNPCHRDSDGDGAGDGTEVQSGTNPTVVNAGHHLPFIDVFETNTAVTGMIDGQNGWIAAPRSSATIQTNVSMQGRQALQIKSTSNTATELVHSFASDGTNVIWLDMTLRTKGAILPTGTVDCVAGFCLATNGMMLVYNPQIGTGTNAWEKLSHVAVGTDEWVRVDVRLDYSARVWDLYLRGIMIKTNAAFTASTPTEFSSLRVTGKSGYIDNLGITADSPFNDPDEDGVISLHEKHGQSDSTSEDSKPHCLYVNPNNATANGMNPGIDVTQPNSTSYTTPLSAAKSIQAVINAINAGVYSSWNSASDRVIYLADGTYRNSSTLINRNLEIPSGYNLTSVSHDPALCIIDLTDTATPSLKYDYGFTFTLGQGADTVISHLTVQNANVNGIHGTFGSPIIQNCTIKNCARFGLRLSGGIVRNCQITANGSRTAPYGYGNSTTMEMITDGGIMLDNDGTVMDSVINNNNGVGVVLSNLRYAIYDGRMDFVHGCTITGNRIGIYNLNRQYTLTSPFSAWNCIVADNLDFAAYGDYKTFNIFTHCTFVNNGNGIAMRNYQSSLMIYNSILNNGTGNELSHSLDELAGVLLKNCAIVGNIANDNGSANDMIYTESNLHISNPMLTADYHLTAASPCIGQCETMLGTEFDIDGDRRITRYDIVDNPDIGADEYNDANALTFNIVGDDKALYIGNSHYDERDIAFGALCRGVKELGRGSFLVCSGDMCDPAKIDEAIRYYIEPSATLYPWYNAVGNHEFDDPTPAGPGQTWLTWMQNFYAGLCTLTAPEIITQPTATSFSGGTGPHRTTYTMRAGTSPRRCRFIMLNEYSSHTTDNAYAPLGGGEDACIHPTMLTWLETQLREANANGEPVIVSGHAPAFPQPDDTYHDFRHHVDALNAFPANRDAFWRLLKDYGAVAYSCGHTHKTSIVDVDGVTQIDIGNAFGRTGDGTGGADNPSSFIKAQYDGSMLTYKLYRTPDGTGVNFPLIKNGVLAGKMIPRTSTGWRYSASTQTGNNWTQNSFVDTGWSDYTGGNTIPAASAAATVYFRKKFWCPEDPSAVRGLRLKMKLSDNATIYVNGQEVVSKYGLVDVAHIANPETLYINQIIPATALQAGENTLAIKINQSTRVSVSVTDSADDAEENISTYAMNTGSSDLEFIRDLNGNPDQLVGVRFSDANIPANAQILGAKLMFVVDEESDDFGSTLTIKGERSSTSARFNSTARNISDRTPLTAHVTWPMESWATYGQKRLSPPVDSILTEIIGTAGWHDNSPMTFIVSGPAGCTYVACSYDSGPSPDIRPRLLAEFSPSADLALVFDAELEYWTGKGPTVVCYNDLALDPQDNSSSVTTCGPWGGQPTSGTLKNFMAYNHLYDLSVTPAVHATFAEGISGQSNHEWGYPQAMVNAAQATPVTLSIGDITPGLGGTLVSYATGLGSDMAGRWFINSDDGESVIDALNAYRWTSDGTTEKGFDITLTGMTPGHRYRFELYCNSGDSSHSAKSTIARISGADAWSNDSTGTTTANGNDLSISTYNPNGYMIVFDDIAAGTDGTVTINVWSRDIGAVNACRILWSNN